MRMRQGTAALARFLRGFSYAGQGLWYVIRTQRNMRVHLVAAAAVVALGVIVGISAADWAAIVLAIGLVLTSETINTVVETLTDLRTTRIHPLAKVAKDASAGAVLIAAITAVGVAIAIFVPRFLG